MTPVLQVRDLHTALDTAHGVVRAVDGVDFDLRRGECFALLGESGCGKSMTALSVMRLLPETGRIPAGRVLLEEKDLLALPEAAMRAVRGRRVAMIFQEPSTALNPVLTVGRQIAEVIERHTGEKNLRERTLELLRAAGIPDPEQRHEQYPFQLSGGLKQRVMIAAALAVDPEVLIADEPTTALDVTIQAQILELLARLQAERGMAVLLITHDLGVVSRMAHRVAVMYAGEIVEVAEREAFIRAPQHPYAQHLFAAVPSVERRGAELRAIRGQVPPLTGAFRGCRFADRCPEAFDRCRDEAPRLLELAGGRQARCHLREKGLAVSREVFSDVRREAQTEKENAILLKVENLKVHFPVRRGLLRRPADWIKAVDGISLELKTGRTLALVGESGSGKTTAGKAVLQLIRPTAGSVRFDGRELTGLSRSALRPHRAAMQIVFQDPYASLNPRLRVNEILLEGMASLGVESGEAARSRRVDELLDQVGLPKEARQRYPHEFSGGQRQRIAIARALAVKPRLIVCDEPTSALDVSVQAQILNLLRALQRELGVAYLFITHNMGVVEYLAHDVAVMLRGAIVEQGPADAVLGRPQNAYTRELLSAVPRLER